jgi:hypothetical protein
LGCQGMNQEKIEPFNDNFVLFGIWMKNLEFSHCVLTRFRKAAQNRSITFSFEKIDLEINLPLQ